jgi:glycosyltransferase involved in cell wall biosynthesis
MDPLVSVVITTYNLGWCVEDTLNSVFAQTYPNIEIIVVDDASTDDTQARLAPYTDRITYIRHATNQGLLNHAEAGPARNTGIRAATGDYIAILDGDDFWEPEKIAVQVDAARQFPRAGIIAVDGIAFAHEDGRVLRSTLLFDANDQFISSLPDGSVTVADLYHRFLYGCLFDTPSQVMIASRVFDAVGLYSECRSDDYEFYIRAAAEFEFVIVKQALVRYRVHNAGISGVLEKQFFRFAQPNLDIWQKHLEVCRPEGRTILRSQIRRHMMDAADRATEFAHRGERRWAAAYLLQLLRDNRVSSASAYVAYRLVLLGAPRWASSALQPLTRRARRLVQ